MSRFPLFGIGQSGKSPKVTAERRVNIYVDPRRDQHRGPASYHQRPGLASFVALGSGAIRGMQVIGDLLYVVRRSKLYSVNNAAQTVDIGTLNTSTGRVGIADNGTQLIIVDGTDGYIYNTSTSVFSRITDSDFVAADTVVFQGGRFIVNRAGTGEIYISASYDGLSWDGTEFATAETFPDDLVAVGEDQGELLLFGSESMEIWQNVSATDFPYVRISGAASEWGMAARWSLAKFGSSSAWLGKNRNGETQVLRLAGYTPQVISTPEVEYAIQSYATVIDASGLAYHSAGHTFYQLNFPTAGVSWVYDMTSGLWSEFQSGTEGGRHKAELSAQFVNRTIVSDYSTGTLYSVDADQLDDSGDEFVKELVSRHLFDEEFLGIGRLWVDMQTGVGTATGQGSDPQIMLQLSKDGGSTWGPEKWTSLGAIGEFSTRALWRRLGRGYDWTMRLRVSDPVQFSLIGAWIDAQ